MTLILSLLLAQTVTVPAGFQEDLYVGGLTSPTSMCFAPDGRIFVCQKTGALRVVIPNGNSGILVAGAFHTVSENNADERGLLGVAFDPAFDSNHRVYVYYCHSNGTENRVSRLTAVSHSSNTSDGTETTLHTVPQASGYHNGGALHVGPVDGKLYLGVGEFHTSANAQSLSSFGGKILRMELDGTAAAGNPTSFPDIAGSTSGAYLRIWAVGLRNPFTFAFQPGTGRMFINDVGHNGDTAWEEIDDGIAGSNYGWPASAGPSADPDHRSPLFAYQHNNGGPLQGVCIAGGAFYNPAIPHFPGTYTGKYFFADYSQQWIYYYNPANDTITPFASGTPINQPVDLQVGPDGALYYLCIGSGQVRRIVYTGSASQAIVTSADSVIVNEGGSVNVDVHLAVDPGAGVTVVVTPGLLNGDPSVSSSPPTLSFTGGAAGTWDDDQVLTINAAEDADDLDEGATLNLFATGLPLKSLAVKTLDNDRAASRPTASISLPKHGAVVTGTNAEFFGDGSDTMGTVVGCTQAEFFIDGVSVDVDATLSGHYHINGGHALWNTTLLTNGAHVLRMTVTDGDGETASHELTVTVQNGATGGGSSGGGGCGALGIEPLLLMLLLRRRRR